MDQVLSPGDGRVTAERVRDALGWPPGGRQSSSRCSTSSPDRRAADGLLSAPSPKPRRSRRRLRRAAHGFWPTCSALNSPLPPHGGAATEVSERARDALVQRRDRLTGADLLRMLQAISELEPRFRKSGQQQLLVETLLVRFALLDRAVDLEEVLRSMGGGSTTAAPAAEVAQALSSDRSHAPSFALTARAPEPPLLRRQRRLRRLHRRRLVPWQPQRGPLRRPVNRST